MTLHKLSPRLLAIAGMFFIASCASGPSDEQKTNYNEAQKTIVENKEAIAALPNEDDKARLTDASAMPVEDYLKKYNVEKEEDINKELAKLKIMAEYLKTAKASADEMKAELEKWAQEDSLGNAATDTLIAE